MIDRFDGDYQFLGNFYSIPVTYDMMSFLSVGHAYAAAKTDNRNERNHIAHLGTAREVIGYSRKLKAREGWLEMRVGIMKELLRQKFSYPAMQRKLLSTGTQKLSYGNSPDEFWGIIERTGRGTDMLGQLLMEIRQEMQNALPEPKPA